MKRIFISGIAGFIGFHAARALKARGDDVFGCDNFNPYYDPSLKRARAKLLEEMQIPVIECDVIDQTLLKEQIQNHSITHFLHLAAQAGVRHSLKSPESYVHSNLNGFVQVLEALRQFPEVKLIYASSSSVYGMNAKVPFAETDTVEKPASFYGATKRCNEVIASSYHHVHGIHCTGLRFFTVYGPWGRPDMAYFSFSKDILSQKTLSVYGEGKLMRDFTYIDDIVQGTLAAIDLGARNEIFNLGNCSPVSVLELISILEECLGKKASLSMHPMPPGDVPITYADISKSQKILGFQPKTPLREGLKKFTEWFVDHYRLLQ